MSGNEKHWDFPFWLLLYSLPALLRSVLTSPKHRRWSGQTTGLFFPQGLSIVCSFFKKCIELDGCLYRGTKQTLDCAWNRVSMLYTAGHEMPARAAQNSSSYWMSFYALVAVWHTDSRQQWCTDRMKAGHSPDWQVCAASWGYSHPRTLRASNWDWLHQETEQYSVVWGDGCGMARQQLTHPCGTLECSLGPHQMLEAFQDNVITVLSRHCFLMWALSGTHKYIVKFCSLLLPIHTACGAVEAMCKCCGTYCFVVGIQSTIPTLRLQFYFHTPSPVWDTIS